MIYKETEQTRMLFVPKQRVHSGRIPNYCDWPKIKEIFDYVCGLVSVWVSRVSLHLPLL
jgi:hypothetical protein